MQFIEPSDSSEGRAVRRLHLHRAAASVLFSVVGLGMVVAAVPPHAEAVAVDLAMDDLVLRTGPDNGGTVVSDPQVGQTVYITVTYDVVASGDITGRIWEVSLDGTPLCDHTGTVTDGSGWWGSCSWTVTAGPHTIEALLDPDGTVVESDELNNSASTAVTVYDGDLAVAGFVMRSEPNNGGVVVTDPAEGDTVYLTITYDAVTSGTLDGRLWEIWINGVEACGFDQSIPSGTDFWGWCSWPVTSGAYSFEARLDPHGEFFETDESNNIASFDLSVPHGNLSITDIVMRSAPDNGGTVVTDPVVGETVYLTVTYDVDASGTLDGRIWEIWQDGAEICGMAHQVTNGTGWWGWCSWIATDGDHVFLAVLDPHREFIEHDEDDNVDSLATGSAVFADGFELGSDVAWTNSTP